MGKAPHELGQDSSPRAPYVIAIPTLGRWRAAREVCNALKDEPRPFILVKTLAFLQQQRIPAQKVHLFVASPFEKKNYEAALAGNEHWRSVRIVVGERGVVAQRNFITRWFDEGRYILSLDDDLTTINWFHRGAIEPLPPGGLERLVFHGHRLLKTTGSFIWGLNTSSNPRALWTDGVSVRCGEINGFCYAFINRHCPSLLPQVADATEDAERSLRYFAKDSIILRYRMYYGVTKYFCYHHGIQEKFGGRTLKEKGEARKAEEVAAVKELRRLFPNLTLEPKEKKSNIQTLSLRFRHLGKRVLPVTSLEALAEANAHDAKGKGNRGSSKRPRSRANDGNAAAAQSATFPRWRRGLFKEPEVAIDQRPASCELQRPMKRWAQGVLKPAWAVQVPAGAQPASAHTQAMTEAQKKEFQTYGGKRVLYFDVLDDPNIKERKAEIQRCREKGNEQRKRYEEADRKWEEERQQRLLQARGADPHEVMRIPTKGVLQLDSNVVETAKWRQLFSAASLPCPAPAEEARQRSRSPPPSDRGVASGPAAPAPVASERAKGPSAPVAERGWAKVALGVVRSAWATACAGLEAAALAEAPGPEAKPTAPAEEEEIVEVLSSDSADERDVLLASSRKEAASFSSSSSSSSDEDFAGDVQKALELSMRDARSLILKGESPGGAASGSREETTLFARTRVPDLTWKIVSPKREESPWLFCDAAASSSSGASRPPPPTKAEAPSAAAASGGMDDLEWALRLSEQEKLQRCDRARKTLEEFGFDSGAVRAAVEMYDGCIEGALNYLSDASPGQPAPGSV